MSILVLVIRRSVSRSFVKTLICSVQRMQRSLCFFHWRTLMITAHSKATDSVLSLRCNISEQKDNHTLVLFRPLVAHHPSLPKIYCETNCIKSHSTIKDNQLAHKTKASTKLPKRNTFFFSFSPTIPLCTQYITRIVASAFTVFSIRTFYARTLYSFLYSFFL